MKIAFYGSSLLSSYWNGAATYYRGILGELAKRGYQITFYEPDAFDRQKHRDIDPPDWAKVVVYEAEESAARRVIAEAARADVVVKASGVGVFDDLLLDGVGVPDIRTAIDGRHALIVVRGYHYKEDLQTLRSYIREYRPVLIGVDGGADALVDVGLKPDMIVGDMDSVSDSTLRCGAEIVVHAYRDGNAPGLDRVRKLGVEPVVFPATGTSEDVAMLLADDKGASLIVAVGMNVNTIAIAHFLFRHDAERAALVARAETVARDSSILRTGRDVRYASARAALTPALTATSSAGAQFYRRRVNLSQVNGSQFPAPGVSTAAAAAITISTSNPCRLSANAGFERFAQRPMSALPMQYRHILLTTYGSVHLGCTQ